MGIYAEIIAIGPFSKDIIEYLEYGADCYSHTKEGAIVSQTLFGIVEGSSLSAEFAEILGISNPWDFNQHKIVNDDIDFKLLRKFINVYGDYERDALKLEVLSKKGFDLHFVPNG